MRRDSSIWVSSREWRDSKVETRSLKEEIRGSKEEIREYKVEARDSNQTTPLTGMSQVIQVLSKTKDIVDLAMYSPQIRLLRPPLPLRQVIHISVYLSNRLWTVVAGKRPITIGTKGAMEATCQRFGGSRWTEVP